jgi:hypothetical protein
MMFHSPLPSML